MKILICGDYVSQNPSAINVDNDLKALFAKQDFIAVNFEAPINGYGSPIAKSGPALTQSSQSPEFLSELGINVALLANNHMMDMGEDGCRATVELLKKSGIKHICGVGDINDAYGLCILEKNNIKVGILNVTHKEFGVLEYDSDYGTAWINHTLVNRRILDAKTKCDFLIIIPHAGVEDLITPLPEWRRRYREFIDFGADAVIASHPHTPQGWEEYNGKPIYYSLGNFFFQMFCENVGDNWHKGLIVEIEIDSNQLSYTVYNTKFTDTSLTIDNSIEAHQLNESLIRLLKNDEAYYKYINDSLLRLWPEYKLYILRGLGAISITSDFHVLSHAGYGLLKGADQPMLLNNFQCESHRWAIERIIKLQLSLK